MITRVFAHHVTVFLVALFVFMAGSTVQLLDSRFTMVASQTIIDHGSYRLDGYMPEVRDFSQIKKLNNMNIIDNHLYYGFPPGPSFFSLPYVAFMKMFGVAAMIENEYQPDMEARIQHGLASILMAGLVAMFFVAARTVLPLGWSWIVALSAGFGTQILSTASRGTWSSTWGIFFLGAIIFLLIRERTGKRLNPYVLATLVSWMYFCRPTNAVTVIIVSVFLLFMQRIPFIVRYAITGISWLAVFMGFSFYNYGKPLPYYYLQSQNFNFQNYWGNVAAHLISPSRGVFIYSPFFLVVIYLVARYRSTVRFPGLAWLASAGICIHLFLVLGTFENFWGGHCYGPRLMTDVTPWFMLLMILGLDAMLSASAGKSRNGTPVRHWLLYGIGAILLAFSCFTHYRGAFFPVTHSWNMVPENVDQHPEKIWDWRHPQFLTGIVE